jgi:hypothetical protein
LAKVRALAAAIPLKIELGYQQYVITIEEVRKT